MKKSFWNYSFGSRAQAMMEFAIALPILMALLVGIFEVGRMVFMYTAVTNASREAVRYASAVGLDDSGSYKKYYYCDGIRDRARRSAYFTPLATIISYDHGPGTGSFDTCDGTADTGVVVSSGDRVKVTVSAQYEPMLKLIPLSPRTFTSSSARTILGYVQLASASTYTPVATATSGVVASDTPTATATATDTPTPTATVSGSFVTFTPSNTPTTTPTDTPTVTFTPTPTNTPQPTSTPNGTLTNTPTFTPTNTPAATWTSTPTLKP